MREGKKSVARGREGGKRKTRHKRGREETPGRESVCENRERKHRLGREKESKKRR